MENGLRRKNFGHPVQTSSITKYKFLQVKKIVNELPVLKLDIYYFRSLPTASTKSLTQNDEEKAGQLQEVKAQYPIQDNLTLIESEFQARIKCNLFQPKRPQAFIGIQPYNLYTNIDGI